jgi:hypothetical protein
MGWALGELERHSQEDRGSSGRSPYSSTDGLTTYFSSGGAAKPLAVDPATSGPSFRFDADQRETGLRVEPLPQWLRCLRENDLERWPDVRFD